MTSVRALRNRLPSVFQNREFVEAGGLLSYAPSTVANYRRAATYVDKILKGAKPPGAVINATRKGCEIVWPSPIGSG